MSAKDIERLARVLREAWNKPLDDAAIRSRGSVVISTSDIENYAQLEAISVVRAILQALREPGEAALEAGMNQTTFIEGHRAGAINVITDVHRAIIDHLLSD